MDIGIIASRYAKTLLRFATDNKEEQAVYAEMLALAEAFKRVPTLQQALVNPVVETKQKVAILQTAATTDAKPSSSTKQFLQLVVDNHRADLMLFIANAYASLYHKEKHIIRGRLIVPAKVSAETEQKLQKMVENRTNSKVEFTTEIDPKIGAGFILEYDTYRLDASLRTQMAELRRALN